LKADREGHLGGPGAKPLTPEQVELARSREELDETKMELEIVKKASAYFAKYST
jgi:transposase